MAMPFCPWSAGNETGLWPTIGWLALIYYRLAMPFCRPPVNDTSWLFSTTGTDLLSMLVYWLTFWLWQLDPLWQWTSGMTGWKEGHLSFMYWISHLPKGQFNLSILWRRPALLINFPPFQFKSVRPESGNIHYLPATWRPLVLVNFLWGRSIVK